MQHKVPMSIIFEGFWRQDILVLYDSLVVWHQYKVSIAIAFFWDWKDMHEHMEQHILKGKYRMVWQKSIYKSRIASLINDDVWMYGWCTTSVSSVFHPFLSSTMSRALVSASCPRLMYSSSSSFNGTGLTTSLLELSVTSLHTHMKRALTAALTLFSSIWSCLVFNGQYKL